MFFRACSVEDFDLRRSRVAVLAGTLVSDDAGVGRSDPLHPLGDGVREGSHPLALSRGCSVGGFGFRRNRRAVNFSLRHFCFRGGLHENFVPDRTGARRVAFIGAFTSAAICTKISFLTKQARDASRSSALLLPRRCKRRFRFRRRGTWGALIPYTPSGTGYERVHTLSRSPGAVRSEVLVSDGTGGRRVWNNGACSSAPIRSKVSTSDDAVGLFWWELWFPTTRAWGALLPYTPSGTGCERVATLSRSPGGCSSAASDFEKMPVAFLWERKWVNRIFSHRDSGAASLSRGTHAQRSSGGRDASEAHTLSLRRTGNL